jgi:hypothetical protein
VPTNRAANPTRDSPNHAPARLNYDLGKWSDPVRHTNRVGLTAELHQEQKIHAAKSSARQILTVYKIVSGR